jgi:hypothetical protein
LKKFFTSPKSFLNNGLSLFRVFREFCGEVFFRTDRAHSRHIGRPSFLT